MKLEISDGRLQSFEIKSLGISFTRQKAAALAGITGQSTSWWWPFIREASAGAWQRNEEIRLDSALSNPTLYACVTLISADIAKLRPRLMQRSDSGVWEEFENTAHSPVLRAPNHFQTWFQFAQWWLNSKLNHGNTYVLKRRDARGVVNGLYILDPTRVNVLQAPDGSYFYDLGQDRQSGIGIPEGMSNVTVPAREIMHDVCSPLFHPKLGVSPIFAAGWPALLSGHIQNNSERLFLNSSSPGGVITAPGHITTETANRLKETFETKFSGDNYGKVAILGDSLQYTPMGMATAVDSQVIEILKWSDEQIAKCYHMPLFKVGGPLPPYSSVEAVAQIYYSDCLQSHVTPFEEVFSNGLELPLGMRISLDIEDLNRMDSATTMEVATKGVQGSVFTPNEARRRFDLPPLKGGDTVYMQHQDYSISVLSDRDALGPQDAGLLDSGKPVTPPAAPVAPEPPADTQAGKVAELEFAKFSRDLLTIAGAQALENTVQKHG